MDERVVGLLDIGSNAVRLLCARVGGAGEAEVVGFGREQIRLGDGGFHAHELRPEAIARAVATCSHFVLQARVLGAGEMLAVATAAVREAGNADTLLDRLRDECGLVVTVLSGEEEAAMAYRAAWRRLQAGDTPLLVLDIGGGSTEVSAGRGGEAELAASLPLGALRLTAATLPAGYAGPVDDARYALLCTEVRQAATGLGVTLRDTGVEVAAGLGGTIRSLACVASAVLPGSRRRSADVLWRSELTQVVDILRAVGLDERRRLPGLDPERADTIVAGAAILETLLQLFAIDELIVPDASLLRDGLLADYVEGRLARRG